MIEDARDADIDSQGDMGLSPDSEGGDSSQSPSGQQEQSLLNMVDDDEGRTFDFSSGIKPEGFPDELWDEEKKQVKANELFENYKKQEKIAQDLRRKLGKGEHKAPKEAGDYKLELSDEMSELIPDDDPVMKMAKETAHKYGMSQEMFGSFMSDIVNNISQYANNPEAQQSLEMTPEQIQEYKQQEFAKIGPNAPQVIRAVQTFGKQMVAEGMFSQEDLQAFESMVTTGEQVRVMNKLRAMRSDAVDVPMDITPSSGVSRQELERKVSDAMMAKDEMAYKKAEADLYAWHQKYGA